MKQKHKKAICGRVARIVLPGSVTRVFSPGTKDTIIKFLLNKVDIEELAGVKNQTAFDKWSTGVIDNLNNAIRRKRGNIKKLGNGTWGHAAKITNLFVSHIICFSRYFPDKEVKRLQFYLHIPLYNLVIEKLRTYGVSIKARSIKEVNKSIYSDVQKSVRNIALKVNVPPIFIDDMIWGLRDQI